MNIDIGKKMRDLRKSKDMSIAELAEKAGLSSGIISQIERNLVAPSIVTFWKISQALEVSVGHFFDEEEVELNISPIVKKSDRKRITVSNSNALYELLSHDLNRKIEFLYITIGPGEVSSEGLVSHEGEECGLVLKGKLLVKTADGDYELNEGDSIYYESTIPHRYINIGDNVCESVWAMTPPSF
ncbi:cupin domain-containing protein [Gudongella oleilytica]|uniref:cupin domain-containing protein n=1 Tax=Gudongella oleilytica TaxID=1582259 RepID=UPI0019CF89EC|nr:cupin domain-containing protein [Gudongella oleilytica]